MLKSLSIKNFALIEQLDVSFHKGLTTITGETGAGKSLLLGAMGLLLGKRADLSTVKDTSSKCSIEGIFDIKKYDLESFFSEEDLDYEIETIIRREILPSGKSRAFINDTPVTLQSLSKLGVKLIDIHSQHETLSVTSNDFQFKVLDAVSGTEKEIASYKRGLKLLKQKQKELNTLIQNKEEFQKEFEYNSYLLNELREAKLIPDELSELEETYEQLNNVEEIQEMLSQATGLMSVEDIGIIDQLTSTRNSINKIASFSTQIRDLLERIQSSLIELQDVSDALQMEMEQLEADPQRLLQVSERLQLVHNLQTKHQVNSVEELILIQEELTSKVQKTESITEDIQNYQKEIDEIKTKLDELASVIHQKRKKHLSGLTEELEAILQSLGMENASFQTEVNFKEDYFSNGKDELVFLFSANKGSGYGELKKVASGGELSRIMISIKAILSRYSQLPTIIFDEIDTGVSGEVAQKMADLMKKMSQNLQVFSITHLPQIAAHGDYQYKVYKEDIKDSTVTQLRLLTKEDRVREIAEMIGGKQISESALTHAKSLLEKNEA